MTPLSTNSHSTPLNPRFDWYQATALKGDGDRYDMGDPDQVAAVVEEEMQCAGLSPDLIAQKLLTAYGPGFVRPGTAFNGYRACLEVRNPDDELVATVMWLGNPGVNIKVTGSAAHALAPAIREMLPRHRVSRCDAALDWSQEGLFDRMARTLLDYAQENDLSINQQGNWEQGVSRTLYIGTRSSASQLVLYEKGYDRGKLKHDGDPHHTRLEARVYPKSRAGEKVAHWSPETVLGGTRMLSRAISRLGLGEFEEQRIGTVRNEPDVERSRRYLLLQYRRVLEDWADEVGGWENLGPALAQEIAEQDEHRRNVDQLATPSGDRLRE